MLQAHPVSEDLVQEQSALRVGIDLRHQKQDKEEDGPVEVALVESLDVSSHDSDHPMLFSQRLLQDLKDSLEDHVAPLDGDPVYDNDRELDFVQGGGRQEEEEQHERLQHKSEQDKASYKGVFNVLIKLSVIFLHRN